MTAAELKQQGNEHFKRNEFEEALSCYTRALELADKSTKPDDRSVLHKNKSACHLKLNDAAAAAAEASSGMRLCNVSW